MATMGEQIKYMGGEEFEEYWKIEQSNISNIVELMK
jgi:hypothetical protein